MTCVGLDFGKKPRALMREREKERACHPETWPPALFSSLAILPGGSLWTLFPLLKLLGIWLTWTFPLLNPLSKCVQHWVHFLVVAWSQLCTYGPVWALSCVWVYVKKVACPIPHRGWDGGMVGAKRAVKWQLRGTAGPVGAAPSVALLFLHYLTFDCLYVLHDKDIWATAL